VFILHLSAKFQEVSGVLGTVMVRWLSNDHTSRVLACLSILH